MMKLIFILMALPVLATTCRKEKKKNDGTYVEGKIIRSSCAGLVMQVLNDDSIGEDGWKDMMNDNKQYDNVFTINNSCKLTASLKAGATLRFKVSAPTNNECAFCMMYDGQTKTRYDLSDVSTAGN